MTPTLPEPHPRIAYFSMEIALEDAIPTYSGGLGVLAGDLLRSAGDLGVPMVGVSLVSRAGYFRQGIRDGAQVEAPQPWDPARHAQRVPAQVAVTIGGREVWIGAWQFDLRSQCSSSVPVPVILLDTDLPANTADDRTLTDHLYGGDATYRLRQEIVLGIGGVRMLRALRIPVQRYHLNEGHSALLTLELLREHGAEGASPEQFAEMVQAVRRHCLFTTHTPVEAGHDQYPYALVQQWLDHRLPAALLHPLAGGERCNLARLALSLSGWVNGVAERHAQTSRALFPGYQVHAITNGVHALSWTAAPLAALYDRHIPNWCHEPELLVRALSIPDDEVLHAHAEARRALLRVPGCAALDAQRFTIGFGRRMTGYKRPGLLFTDLARLRAIGRRTPLQVVVAGKAHPRDLGGKRIIEELHAAAAALAPDLPVVFLPDYGVELARAMVAGVDLWLNTPQPPLEASGTSGMKAALNGVPSLSVLDGWWLEGCAEGMTGWAIGSDGDGDDARSAASLYDKLEYKVLPAWTSGGGAWAGIMKAAIARNGSYFNSHRMLRRYASEAYWR
ncbi:MAG: alpha-glucan family phosphorylase [Ramlibacter sp.]